MRNTSAPMKKNGLTPIASAVAVLVLSTSFAVHAQEAAPAAPKVAVAEPVQEIRVTGIRASLQNAVNIKRNSAGVVDAVSAEDVGKLPDSDVGESLGRIPGITVGRAFGQGATVSVRGSDPQMTYTTLNGQTVASTGWYDQQAIDRSFNYSLLPSELIGGLEVYKSSQADLTEGGIGGTVIVKTRKPLDLKANTMFAGVSVGRGTVSDDLSKEVSGLYSWRNEGKTFGVLVGGAVDKAEYIRRGVEANLSWNGDVAAGTFVQDRERTAFNINLQARPMTGLNLGLNYLKLELDADASNSSHYVFINGANNTCTQTNAAGACVSASATAATSNFPFVQTWARGATMSSESLVFDASFKGKGFKVDAVVGTTEADGGTNLTANYGYGSWVSGFAPPMWSGTIDATGNKIKMTPTSNQSVTLANLPATTALSSWAAAMGPNSDKENFGQADLTLSLNWGAINSFKTGVRVADHTFEKFTFRGQFPAVIAEAPTSSLYHNDTIKMGTVGWSYPKPNTQAMLDDTRSKITSMAEDRSAYAELNEVNTALYGMFNFEKEELSGNFGARLVRTEVESTNYAFNGSALAAGDIAANEGFSATKSTEKSSYSAVLPSLNLAVKLRNDLTMRFTASQVMTRPNFENMFGVNRGGFNDDQPNNLSITFGSGALQPMKSTQMDLGLDYYYGKGNLMSVMYFHKDITNFVTTQTEVNQSIGISDPRFGEDNWTVNRFVNAGGGKIDGIEAQINHGFNNGFGVVANYTYSKATAPSESYADEVNIFTNSSKHNANLVGYWENQSFSARLAYNWRSKYMVRETGYYSNRMHDAFGTLDASLGWNINDNFRLQFEANNLLKEDDVQYGAAAADVTTVRPALRAGYPAWSFMGETTYKLSLSAKF